jgi:GNAT superfamily N-acetyltransferase
VKMKRKTPQRYLKLSRNKKAQVWKLQKRIKRELERAEKRNLEEPAKLEVAAAQSTDFLVYHHAHKAITFGRSISKPLRAAKDLFDKVLEPMSFFTKTCMASAGYETLTARFDTEPTAVVAALTYKLHGQYVEIVLMGTEPKHRNKGAARSLLNEVFSIAKKQNASAVIANVSNPAIEAYVHMGFSKIAN